MNSIPPAVVLLGGALALPLLPRSFRSLAFVLFPAAAMALLPSLEDGITTLRFLSFDLVPLRVDRLSLAFGTIFLLATLLGGIYAFHLKELGQQVAALIYAGSSLGVVFSGDLFTLFVYWEIMAVSSAYLILARGMERSRRAAMRYVLVHLFGGSVLLAGILWHFVDSGSLLFNGFDREGAAYLIMFGFALNAGIPPLHAWLADAYPEGTVTGSVFLSAFTTKTAVYVLARGFAGWEILLWAGVIMALYGVVFAVLENDIRRLLAYHIISQVGYMVAGVGLGTETAINGTTAHAFCHILYKGLLFMGAGAVLYSTNRTKLTELGGLARAIPVALSLYMVGAFSISGFPLFSGFVSKSLVIHAAELGHEGVIALLLYLASIGTFLHTGLKLPYFTWFGPQRGLKPAPIPWSMYAGMTLTAGINIAIGVYPKLLYDLMPFPVTYRPYTTAHVAETLQLLVGTGLGFWLLIDKLGGKSTITLDFDWFYRKPAPLLFRLTAGSLNRFFTAAELTTSNLAHRLAQACANPVEFASRFLSQSGDRGDRDIGGDKVLYDPNRYRPPVGFIILIVLSCFVFLLAWNLFLA
ncbi:MAG TPA: Na(+)/H(+) antiporter subunit D [Candidatus Binatia bacterium]